MIHIVSGPIGSGKTSLLHEKYKANPHSTSGIIMPDIAGEKYFAILGQNTLIKAEGPRSLEKAPKPQIISIKQVEYQQVGLRNLLSEPFTLFNTMFTNINIDSKHTFILDEIGTLELYSLGFSELLISLLKKETDLNFTFYIAMRESIINELISKYHIINYQLHLLKKADQ